MLGCKYGVQHTFKKKDVPHAFYIHCHAHRLNLVLVDVVSNVDAAVESVNHITSPDALLMHCFYSIIDKLVGELKLQ